MLETMNTAMIVEVIKHIWWGVVIISSTYMIMDTIRVNKARELKAMVKMEKMNDER